MYVLLKCLARLPLPILYGLSSLGYLVLYYVARYRRQVVLDNLRHAFPEWSEGQRQHIARLFYRQLCDVAMECLRSAHMPPEAFIERVEFANPELLQQFVDRQQSVLLLALHQSNWEWLLHGISQRLHVPLDAVYKPLHQEAVDRFIRESRERFGSQPIPMANAMREILRRRREFRLFAMVADQSPFKRERRYWAEFFGRPASFFLGPDVIAKATQYPVVFVDMKRLRRGYYQVRFELLAEPPHPKDGDLVLPAYVRAAEQAIREQPESWLWSNRKWKHRPPVDLADSKEHNDTGS